MTSASTAIADIENWLRLGTFLQEPLKETALIVFHDPIYGLPKNPVDLYHELDTKHRKKIDLLRNRNIIKKEQYDLIFPTNDNKTYSNKFDITLLAVLIQNCTTHPPPANGWKDKNPEQADQTVGANVIRLREWRNYFHHAEPKDIDNNTFNGKWNEGVDIITALGSTYDHQTLKAVQLDPKLGSINILLQYYKDIKSDVKNLDTAQNNIDTGFKNLDTSFKILETDVKTLYAVVKKLDKRISEVEVNNKEEKRRKDAEGECESQDKRQIQVQRLLPNGFVVSLKLNMDEYVEIKYNFPKHNTIWKLAKYDMKELNGLSYIRVESLENIGQCKVNMLIFDKTKIVIKAIPEHIIDIVDYTRCQHDVKIGNLIMISPASGINDIHTGDIHFFCQDTLLNGKHVNKSTSLSLTVTHGACAEVIDVERFTALGKEYFERNFANLEEVIAFPPSCMISDESTSKIAYSITASFEKQTDLRILINSYDDKKYYRYINKDSFLLEQFNSLPLSSNRLLLFNSSPMSIINIRVLSEDATADCIHREISNCIEDMKSFSYTFKHIVNDLIVISGVIACPSLGKEDVENQVRFYFSSDKQSLINLFFLTKEDLLTEDTLTKWFDTVFKPEIQRINHFNGGALELPCNDVLKRIAGQCMATIACVDLASSPSITSSLPILPTLSPNPYKQICSLLLNTDQLHAIHNPDLKKLIKGPYGSGKTVVGEELVRSIYTKSLREGKKVLILYVLYDIYTLMEVKNISFIKSLKEDKKNCINSELVTLLCGSLYSLGKDINNGIPSLFEFLLHYVEKGEYEMINLILDEVSCESITSSETKAIRNIFETYLKLQYVIVMQQSIEMERVLFVDRKEYPRQRNCLDQLGLSSHPLKRVMRNTEQIVSLANSAQETIMSNTNIVVYPQSSTDRVDIPKDKKHVIKRSLSPFKRQRKKEEEKVSPKETVLPKRLPENIETRNVSLNFDKICSNSKFVANQNDEDKTGDSLETSFRFIESLPGSKIKGNKPVLIELPKLLQDLQSETSAKILSIVLQEICFKNWDSSTNLCNISDDDGFPMSPTIICNNIEECKISSYALELYQKFKGKHTSYIPQLRGILPTVDEKKSIYEQVINEGKILITDHTGVRGLEFQRIVIFVKPEESFLRHVLVEVLTRANVLMFILVLPASCKSGNSNIASLQNVINGWLGGTDNSQIPLVDLKNVMIDNTTTSLFQWEKNVMKINLESSMFKSYGVLLKQSFNEYVDQNLDSRFSCQLTTDYDRLFRTMTSRMITEQTLRLHNIQYEDAVLNFTDVYRLLQSEDYAKFLKIQSKHRNILNELRNEKDHNRTLLHHACTRANENLIKYLLAHGANIALQDDHGWTAFHHCASIPDYYPMKMLIEHDASGINIVTYRKETALHCAAKINNLTIIGLLLNYIDVNAKDYKGRTADQMETMDSEETENLTRKLIKDHPIN